MGRPQYIADQDLNMLNKDVNKTIGLSEKNGTLSTNISTVKSQIDNEYGHYVNYLTPCRKTTHFYQMLTVKDDVIFI